VEDDDMNLICFGGRTTGIEVAWECTKKFLRAKFTGAGRHRRPLAKVAKLEHRKFAA
jgi:ribose 5-phosphate isomerase B